MSRSSSSSAVRSKTHRYNHEFDPDHEELMPYWQWQKFPLEPGDDN